MKFAIESIGLTAGGGKELALDLMTRLAGHTEHQFTCIVPDLGPYKAISGSNIRTFVCKKGAGLLERARLLDFEVPRICREVKADALLCLGNFVPWKQVCPTVVLMHNPWVVYRDTVAEARRTRRENLITAYARHAYRHLPSDITIITQTPVMKDHLCGRYGIDPGRVAIIPNTFSLANPGGNGDRAPSDGDEPAKPFTFLYLTHYYAHKNIDFLIDATGKLPNYTEKSAKCLITIAAEQHPGARRLLERLDGGEAAGKVENIGPVPSKMLPQIYRRADALIFPSLLESYSRTYLEAMYFGLPILTSDRDFARERCRGAAIYFDPLNAASVARAMARVMEDADLRNNLVENGRSILAQAPTWDEIAARFVEVLERTARGESPVPAKSRSWHAVRSFGVRQLAAPFSPASSLAGNRPPDRNSREQARGKESGSELPHSKASPQSNDVRTLFNQKARRWRSKYGPKGKLNSRVEHFTARLAELCPPPGNILDLGCGTGEIAAAIDHMGYQITACDLADEMIDIARRSYGGTSVNWVCLEPDWEALPFEDSSFDGVIASSVFEYLDDVRGVAAELARVLRPEGILLLTVPNPCNIVRKVEAGFYSMLLRHRLPPLLRRIQRIDAYAAYLRLSRNRFEAPGWQSVLSAAHFAALDENDFSPEAWQHQAQSPLVLLAVKRVATLPSCCGDTRRDCHSEETQARPFLLRMTAKES